MTEIKLWHGGTRWESKPEIKPVKPGRYEAGPGIYLTSSYERARSYAKGGKVTTLVTLIEKSKIRWLESAKVRRQEILKFLYDTPRLRQRDQIVDYFDKLEGDLVPASYLVNLCVNYDALTGANGPLLAKWLVSQGIDASLHSPKTGESWVIVFNPEIIKLHTVVPAKMVNLSQYDLSV
ncbi:hypothetical protein [Comamonas thiooxydans]|uniref:hypothetical protein n=1 Tax=Comamonas thiooxydans TaxID=363952 RepID=UPI000B41C138|nr:hypothetical protein [Comamonas thiooxydans]